MTEQFILRGEIRLTDKFDAFSVQVRQYPSFKVTLEHRLNFPCYLERHSQPFGYLNRVMGPLDRANTPQETKIRILLFQIVIPADINAVIDHLRRDSGN